MKKKNWYPILRALPDEKIEKKLEELLIKLEGDIAKAVGDLIFEYESNDFQAVKNLHVELVQELTSGGLTRTKEMRRTKSVSARVLTAPNYNSASFLRK